MIIFSISLSPNHALSVVFIHDLRRSAITNWAKYLPIQVTQQLAGHSSLSTTRKYYIAVRPEDIASASYVINKIMERVEM